MPTSDWIKDLDKRCEEHLRIHPEFIPQPAPTRIVVSTKNMVVPLAGLRVQVLEGPSPDSWAVYEYGKKIITFFGDDSLASALKYAKELLD